MDRDRHPPKDSPAPDAFDAAVAKIIAALIAADEKPTVRTIAERMPGAGNTRISGALRRFRRAALSRIVGLFGSLAPTSEEPVYHRIAIGSAASPANLVSIDIDGVIVRVALPDLIESVIDRRNVHQASPADGGGMVVFLRTNMPIAVRLSRAEMAFLAGKAATLEREDDNS